MTWLVSGSRDKVVLPLSIQVIWLVSGSRDKVVLPLSIQVIWLVSGGVGIKWYYH